MQMPGPEATAAPFSRSCLVSATEPLQETGTGLRPQHSVGCPQHDLRPFGIGRSRRFFGSLSRLLRASLASSGFAVGTIRRYATRNDADQDKSQNMRDMRLHAHAPLLGLFQLWMSWLTRGKFRRQWTGMAANKVLLLPPAAGSCGKACHAARHPPG